MKNKTNKQIIKALSIGISASMMLQPMVAFADETQEPAPATPDDHVSTVAPTVVDIQQFVDADKAIENAETKVGEAETATGIEFDNSKDEVAAATGKTETVEENLQQAESNMELANENGKEVVKNQKDIETKLDEENFNQNVADANQGYADAKKAAEESKEISDKVTPNMSSSEATALVNQASAKYNEANTALVEANKKYDVAKATYEAAAEKLATAQAKADATAEEIKAAQDELATAKASLDSFAQDVADAQTAAEEALQGILGDDYQKIQDEKDKLAKGETTADAYAQLLIKSFIKANGGTFSEFSTTEKTNVTGLNEDGTNATASTTYNTVKYTDANGDVVEDIYKVSVAEDGTVSVVKMTVEEVADTDNVLKEAVEGKEATPAGYKLADGTVKAETENTEYKTIGETNYAVDKSTKTTTENSKVSTSATDSVQYTAVENSSNTAWVDSYKKVTEYNKKTVVAYNGSVRDVDTVKDMVKQYADKDFKVTVGDWIFTTTYDIEDPSLWAQVVNFFDRDFDVKIEYTTDDLTSPKTYETVQGVAEVTTTQYTEKAKVSCRKSSDWYTDYRVFGKVIKDGKKQAEDDAAKIAAKLRDEGKANVRVLSAYRTVANAYRCDVVWDEYVTNTVTVQNATSTYSADAYTEKVAAQDAVEAQDAVYGTKLSTTDGASLVQSDLNQKLKDQKDRKEAQEAAVQQAKDAVEAYNKAVEAVEAAQEKVDNLVEQNVTTIALSIAQAELEAAKEALNTATENKEAAEEAVKEAAGSLEVAQGILNTINASNQTPSGNVSTPAPAAGEVLGANRQPAAAEEEGQVLGARKSPKTSDANNALPWMGAMAGAMAGMFGVFAKKRKDEE